VAALTVAADRLPRRLVRVDAARLPVADGAVEAAVTFATLDFTADPVTVLAAMMRAVRACGSSSPCSTRAAPGGLLEGPGCREPYRSGCFLPPAALLGSWPRTASDGRSSFARRSPHTVLMRRCCDNEAM
jgi:hypothetical protein